MIHNVGSYNTPTTGHEHNLENCVHKHSGNFPDTDMDIKNSGQSAKTQQEQTQTNMLDWLSDSIRKIWETDLGCLGAFGMSLPKREIKNRLLVWKRERIYKTGI